MTYSFGTLSSNTRTNNITHLSSHVFEHKARSNDVVGGINARMTERMIMHDDLVF